MAIGLWAVVWLPGLAWASWRAERLLRAGRVLRAGLEVAAIALVPLAAFAFYALPDAQRHAQAHGATLAWGDVLSVAAVALPYAVSAACLGALLRRRPPPAGSRWWVGVLLGLLAVLLLAPGLLMAQLMVLAGG